MARTKRSLLQAIAKHARHLREAKEQRDEMIKEAVTSGEATLGEVAEAAELTRPRVHQIAHGRGQAPS